MGCCRYHDLMAEGGDPSFTVDPPKITFGLGCLREAGPRARRLGMRRVALMTDAGLADSEFVGDVRSSLQRSGCEVAVYDACAIEPTDLSFLDAAAFARDGRFDGYVSVGGGSVMDTCKAANLYATHPADFLAYVNAPIGRGEPVPGPLRPHLACPTTAGTGSEGTGIAVFDLLERHVKTGIAHAALRPSEALVDPRCALTLPPMVTACGAFDVLCHALESYTARPYTRRPAPEDPTRRPASQGANPWSDMGCREALRLLGSFLVRGVADGDDVEARSELMWASTLAGIAFGNAGVHAPHGMAYAVAGMVRDYRAPDYPDALPIVPHGMSVVLTAPALFERTAPVDPGRHLEAAALLGADVGDAAPDEAGPILGTRLVELMRACKIPNGLSAVGYSARDIPALTQGAMAQQRLMVNAPVEMTASLVSEVFAASLTAW